MKVPNFKIILSLLGLLTLSIADFCTLSDAQSLQEVEQSRIYKKTIGGQRKKHNFKDYYTKKWFDPASFYGQVFLRDNGEQFLYEWLELPAKTFSPVDTEVNKQAEYFEVSRSYLDDHSKSIKVTILVPHPRSLESIHQGLVPKFIDFTPKDAAVVKKSELVLGEHKGILYQLQDGQCAVLMHSAKETLVETRVENCKQESNLIALTKALNLTLLSQRLES